MVSILCNGHIPFIKHLAATDPGSLSVQPEVNRQAQVTEGSSDLQKQNHLVAKGAGLLTRSWPHYLSKLLELSGSLLINQIGILTSTVPGSSGEL